MFSIFFTLSRIIRNINISDNEQEVTEHIEKQQDIASSEVFQQIEKIQQ